MKLIVLTFNQSITDKREPRQEYPPRAAKHLIIRRAGNSHKKNLEKLRAKRQADKVATTATIANAKVKHRPKRTNDDERQEDAAKIIQEVLVNVEAVV